MHYTIATLSTIALIGAVAAAPIQTDHQNCGGCIADEQCYTDVDIVCTILKDLKPGHRKESLEKCFSEGPWTEHQDKLAKAVDEATNSKKSDHPLDLTRPNDSKEGSSGPKQDGKSGPKQDGSSVPKQDGTPGPKQDGKPGPKQDGKPGPKNGGPGNLDVDIPIKHVEESKNGESRGSNGPSIEGSSRGPSQTKDGKPAPRPDGQVAQKNADVPVDLEDVLSEERDGPQNGKPRGPFKPSGPSQTKDGKPSPRPNSQDADGSSNAGSHNQGSGPSRGKPAPRPDQNKQEDDACNCSSEFINETLGEKSQERGVSRGQNGLTNADPLRDNQKKTTLTGKLAGLADLD